MSIQVPIEYSYCAQCNRVGELPLPHLCTPQEIKVVLLSNGGKVLLDRQMVFVLFSHIFLFSVVISSLLRGTHALPRVYYSARAPRGGVKMTERIRCALSIIARCQSQPSDFAVG